MVLEDRVLKDKIRLLVNYYNIKDFNKVIDESNRLLKKHPNLDSVWNLLGLSYQQKANYDKAEQTFFRALQINPRNISALNNLGNNFKYLTNFESAEEYFEKALNLNSNYIGALVNLANLKFDLNKPKEALIFLNRALKLNDKELIIHLNLSLIYQSLGEFDSSVFHLRKINELFPNFTRADKMLSALTNYKNEKQHLISMQNKLKNLKLDDGQKIPIYFAISKAYEDNNDFLKAHEYFEKGNKLKRKQSDYSIKKEETLFQNIKKLFSNLDINKFNVNTSSKNIIFIVGMPRSGTTLVEQIISSHGNIYGAGELGYLSKIIYKKFFNDENTSFIRNIEDVDNLNFEEISKKYHNYLKNFDFSEDYITDKALLNFLWIGFIKILFPTAKIINCVRNPKENCLSIYKNLFEHEGPWCYDKLELITFYNLYLDLMKFWETKFPNTIYNMQYEDLVKNPNIKIKELINNIGVNWDDKCLKFYENKNVIKTLSVNQARKNIYTTSLSLYDNYKPYLLEFSRHFNKN